MKLLSQSYLVNGIPYLITRWKPLKGRAYYQLFKYNESEKDYIYTNISFPSLKKAKEHLKSLEK